MIQIINEPHIQLIGTQTLLLENIEKFLEFNHLGTWQEDAPGKDGERLAEFGGRLCYQATGSKQGRKRNDQYLANIVDSQHFSVIEHAVWTFAISGISRSLSHELIRHRVGMAVSELSQRYVDLSQISFVRPPDIHEVGLAYDIWSNSCQASLTAYEFLVDELMRQTAVEYPDMGTTDRRKHARQGARSVLPNSTETMAVLTFNARALRHIIELRGGDGAEIEIRRLAVALLAQMRVLAPNLFSDLVLTESKDSVPTIRKQVKLYG